MACSSTLAPASISSICWGKSVTLLFLPALYAAWFRVKRPENGVSALAS